MALPFIHALTLPQIKFNFCHEQRLFYIIYGLPAFGKIDTLPVDKKRRPHAAAFSKIPSMAAGWQACPFCCLLGFPLFFNGFLNVGMIRRLGE
jgi:hypothetical protein